MDQLLTWIQNITSAIVSLGYPGVFLALVCEGLGLPFPGDGFLVFYGYAVAEGNMNGLAVLSMSTLGYYVGVSIVYWLARYFGKILLDPLYKWKVLNATQLARTSSLMSKYGILVLVPGRFLPGVRSLSTYAAAFGGISYSTFSFYTLVSAVLWCGMWIGLGFWFGENMQSLLQHVQTTLMWLTIAIVILIFLVWIMRKFRAKAKF